MTRSLRAGPIEGEASHGRRQQDQRNRDRGGSTPRRKLPAKPRPRCSSARHGEASRAEGGKREIGAVGKAEWHEFTVDVWITNLNSVEFGIFKHSRNRAKSRQFTLDMDVFAEVIENGERTGLIAYREELWKKKEGMDRRLVLRLFGDKLNWRATMDLMLARSLQLTIGARGIPVSAYSINTGEQVHNIYRRALGQQVAADAGELFVLRPR